VDVFAGRENRTLMSVIEQVARTDATVLILGERGVGHARVARAVHALSSRRHHPFHEVSCAAQPMERLDSELFGDDEMCAGACRRLPGKFALADAGSILLDDVSEMPLPLQSKLLHVLEDGRIPRLADDDVTVRARVMVASHRDLRALVEQGTFRPELYYCINVLLIHVPPLRERRDEILGLVRHLLARYEKVHGRTVPWLSPQTQRLLVDYPWPGNLDELENLIERVVVLGTDDWVADELTWPRSGWTTSPDSRSQSPDDEWRRRGGYPGRAA
jgi:DNA-binding NtrC family response regulator